MLIRNEMAKSIIPFGTSEGKIIIENDHRVLYDIQRIQWTFYLALSKSECFI